MKNLSAVFNVILLVLVGILFVLYFSLKKGAGNSQSSETNLTTPSGKQKMLRIAYVNADTINARYQLMTDFKKEIQSRQGALQNEYDAKAKILQDEYTDYQQKAQAGNISQIDAEKKQKDMEQKKAELDNMQGRLDDLMKEVQDRNAQIQQTVEKYIAQYNKKTHFDYVLTYASAGTNILYANDSLDITNEIVKGLNAQYQDSLKNTSIKPH